MKINCTRHAWQDAAVAVPHAALPLARRLLVRGAGRRRCTALAAGRPITGGAPPERRPRGAAGVVRGARLSCAPRERAFRPHPPALLNVQLGFLEGSRHIERRPVGQQQADARGRLAPHLRQRGRGGEAQASTHHVRTTVGGGRLAPRRPSQVQARQAALSHHPQQASPGRPGRPRWRRCPRTAGGGTR